MNRPPPRGGPGGRWPHMHFEVDESLDVATQGIGKTLDVPV